MKIRFLSVMTTELKVLNSNYCTNLLHMNRPVCEFSLDMCQGNIAFKFSYNVLYVPHVFNFALKLRGFRYFQ